MSESLKESDLGIDGAECLSGLLPYDPHVKIGGRLKDGLKEYLFLLTAAEEAAHSMMSDDLQAFDPLVGENACQIRAVKLATIVLENAFDCARLLKDVLHAKEIVSNLLDSDLSKEPFSLRDMLIRDGISVRVSHNERFLIKSYLLTKVKNQKFKAEMPLVNYEYMDVNGIKGMGKVGLTFRKNLINHLRKKMSEVSVEFVQEIASRHSSFEPHAEMVSDKYLIKHRDLDCLPCYWMTKVLLHEAIINKIPIVMKVEQIAKDRDYAIVETLTLYFQVTQDGYEEVLLDSLNPDEPVLVFMGRACDDFSELSSKDELRGELLKYKPIDLILANAAIHRQYPDAEKDHLVSSFQDDSYRFHQSKSHEWGCSYTNPSLFFIAHIHCNKIKNLKN